MSYKSEKGKGFVQPNALLSAAETTSGVVLTASGTIRISNTLGDAKRSSGSDNLSFSSLGGLGPSSASGVRRGRGANATPSIGTAQPETIKKTAAKSRTDIVEVPYSGRVWRNVIMQYSEGRYVDPTPLTILGVASPEVGGVKGIEPYYAPPSYNNKAAKKGPYAANMADIFTAAVRTFKDSLGADNNAHGEIGPSATDNVNNVFVARAEEAEKKDMKYLTSHRRYRSDDEEDSDVDEDGNVIITLPMLKPPVARPPSATEGNYSSSSGQAGKVTSTSAVGPTLSMVMNHTISGNVKFTYTDYDGVTSAAIVPIINVPTEAGAGGAPDAAANNNDDDDDDEGPQLMDEDKDGGGEGVSAYLNPKAKSNRKYFVRKADLPEGERVIFERLWTIWRNGFVANKGPSNAQAQASLAGGPSATAPATTGDTSSFGKQLGFKRLREGEENHDRRKANNNKSFISSTSNTALTGTNATNNVSASSATDMTQQGRKLTEDEEIARMIRATEEELAALQRDLF